MPGSARTLACLGVIAAKQMKNVRGLETDGAVYFSFLINQERESNAGVFAKHAGIILVAQADRSEVHSGFQELLLMLAQLRDVLAAEDSPVVAEKDDHGLAVCPQRSETDLASIGVGQSDRG